LRAVEKGACFLLDKIAEIRIADRMVEIGELKIVPDNDSEFVA
jgi:hypothetical protein